MVTNQDRVEAGAFVRLRLVTAFVSGKSWGQPSEPVPPGRAIVVGALLTLLLLAGVAAARYVAAPALDIPPAQPSGEVR